MRPLLRRVMNNIEEILAVYIINEENLDALKKEYGTDIMPSSLGTDVEFKIGNVIVIQTIHSLDLFIDRFKCTKQYVWIAPLSEFNEKFNIVDDAHKCETFAIITRK